MTTHALLVLHPLANTLSQTLALKHSTMLTKHQSSHIHSFSSRATLDVSAPPSPTGSDGDRAVAESFRIGIVIHAESAIRVNTIPNFLEVNRRVSSIYSAPIYRINRASSDTVSSVIFLANRSQKSIPNRSEIADIHRYHHWGFYTGGRASGYQEIGHRTTLCYRKYGENCWLHIIGSLCGRRGVRRSTYNIWLAAHASFLEWNWRDVYLEKIPRWGRKLNWYDVSHRLAMKLMLVVSNFNQAAIQI